MSKCQDLRKEFQGKHFGFNHYSPKLFVLSECGPRLLYPIWTGVWALWHLSWLLADLYIALFDNSLVPASKAENNSIKLYFTYVTNWGYMCLVFSNLVDFVASVYVHCKRRDILYYKTDGQIHEDMPWYLKFNWFLFETSNAVGVVISVAYYGLLSPWFYPTSIAKHALNSLYILVNLFVCAKPIRIVHVIYPVIFAVVYIVCSVIYYAGGGAPIYPILDWTKPGMAIMYSALLSFVGVPVVHIVLFALSNMRIYIHEHCCRT